VNGYLQHKDEYNILLMAEPCNLRGLGVNVVDPNTVVKVVRKVTAEEKMRQEMMSARPSLDEIFNLHDFEVSFWRQKNPERLYLKGSRKGHPSP
jgi:hypothetical protein